MYEKPPRQSQPVVTTQVQQAVLKAYLWMFLGVLVSALVAWVSLSFHVLDFVLYRMPFLSILLMLVQIGIAVAMGVSLYRFSASTMKILFLLYAALLGFTVSSLAYVYTSGEVFMAFGLGAVYYGALAVLGSSIKKDLTGYGPVLMVGLIILLISQLIMMFLNVPWATRLVCIFGLLLFSGLTAFDVQRLNKTMLYSQGHPVMQEKWAIFFAFQLYLDFINIFLYMLRLLGGSGSSSRR